jgi:hypothetical protein
MPLCVCIAFHPHSARSNIQSLYLIGASCNMVVKDTRRVCTSAGARSSFNKKNVPLIQRPHYEIWMLETVMAPAAPRRHFVPTCQQQFLNDRFWRRRSFRIGNEPLRKKWAEMTAFSLGLDVCFCFLSGHSRSACEHSTTTSSKKVLRFQAQRDCACSRPWFCVFAEYRWKKHLFACYSTLKSFANSRSIGNSGPVQDANFSTNTWMSANFWPRLFSKTYTFSLLYHMFCCNVV